MEVVSGCAFSRGHRVQAGSFLVDLGIKGEALEFSVITVMEVGINQCLSDIKVHACIHNHHQ